ncbi:PQQ-binding-like beta-propeller repeat protein [Phycisphaeraceae bacterium D3-23]
MVKRWVVVGTVVLLGLGGCAGTSSSNTGQGDGNSGQTSVTNRPTVRTGHLIEPGAASELGYRISWARDMELRGRQHLSSVTVLGDLVVTVERPENLITARSVRDGQLVWKVKIGSSLEHFFAPNRDGDRIFINTQTRMFTLRANSGDVTSVASLEVAVNAAPVYHADSDLAIFGGANGLVFAHSVNNNFARWRYKLPGRVSTPPVSTDRDVFVVDTSGNYVMLEITTGTIQWRNRTLGSVVAAPAIQGNDILIASRDRKLYALNRTSGADTWQYLGAEQPLTATPVALGRLVVLPLPPSGGIVAIGALDGEEQWRSDLNATPIVERDRDLLLHTSRSLLLLDLDEGETLVDAPTLELQTVVPGPNGSLILVSPEGRLLRINRTAG